MGKDGVNILAIETTLDLIEQRDRHVTSHCQRRR
jgi:hypothetical protein